MAKEHPPDQAAENEDIDDVLSTLDRVGARVAAGTIAAVVAILKDLDGNEFCVSAGSFRRQPESILRPALRALVQLCEVDEHASSGHGHRRATGQVLH